MGEDLLEYGCYVGDDAVGGEFLDYLRSEREGGEERVGGGEEDYVLGEDFVDDLAGGLEAVDGGDVGVAEDWDYRLGVEMWDAGAQAAV